MILCFRWKILPLLFFEVVWSDTNTLKAVSQSPSSLQSPFLACTLRTMDPWAHGRRMKLLHWLISSVPSIMLKWNHFRVWIKTWWVCGSPKQKLWSCVGSLVMMRSVSYRVSMPPKSLLSNVFSWSGNSLLLVAFSSKIKISIMLKPFLFPSYQARGLAILTPCGASEASWKVRRGTPEGCCTKSWILSSLFDACSLFMLSILVVCGHFSGFWPDLQKYWWLYTDTWLH